MEGNFQFANGDVVLAEWTDKLFYAKILRIDVSRLTCTLLFDDDSIEECPTSNIHSVTETTADIVCIICKDGSSCRPNEIVLCDKCGIGYHQKCHEPYIADNALEPDAPWMCAYCTNGTECPYLLNPFEAKIKGFTSNSRKQRGLTKDNECPSDRKADFRNNNNNNNNNNNRSECPRPLMEDYYDDHHRRIELNTSTSANTARHILRDHHAISRRGMLGHRISGDHGNRFYKFPKSYDGSRERLHYRQMESVAKRRRMVGQEKQTQDVWDNGYIASRDPASTPEKVDPRNKVAGKEGPREKQRLTQDLERQRKKLKEDMERGQVLEREHSQLLTSRPKNDATADGKSDTEESTKHENTLYFHGREWTAERNQHENRKEINSNDKKLGKKRNSNLSENTSITRGVNESVKHEPRRQLDPCGCEGTEGQGSGSQEKREEDNNLQGIVGEISEMQCEHSMNSRDPHEGETTEYTYEDLSPPNARDVTVVELREELGSEGNINNVDERVFTSEKVEVIGRSDDIISNHEENVRQSAKGKAKKGQSKSVGRAHKRFQKSFSEKTNYDNKSEVNDGLLHESRTQKTKESEHVGSVKTDLMHEGSSGLERQSILNSDNEIHDTEDGEIKEKIKSKSHDITHEGESNAKKDDDEVQNVINQNRVRSDLPRHNWLIERLRNEKKLPPGGSTDSPKEKRLTTDEIVVDSEVTSIKSPGDVEVSVLENTPNNRDVEMETNDRDETSSIEEKDEEEDEEPGSPNFELLSPKSVKNSPENHLSPELKQYSPTRVPASPCEDDELQKPPSPLLKVPEFPGNSLGVRRKSVVREHGENNEIIVEDTFVLHDGGEKRCTLYQRHSVHAVEENLEIIVDDKEQGKIIKDGKIIEIKSDGEGNEDIKENNDTSPEREMLKITTGRSVNPVSPFLRSERRSMEEQKPGSYAPHHHAMLPQSPRFPADLPSHFIKPGYIPGYPPRTFTPHLITHNPPALAAVSPGHLGHLATRMNLAGHSKPDHNCPYHGKKATDKLPQHTPGYPTMHSDHHHLGGIPFYEGVPDFALHEKLRETHAQMASDPIGFHRRLPSLYDSHRQIVMAHGMPGHVFPPGYLPPRLQDEHMLLLDRERFERRMFAIHEPQKHAHSGLSEEHRNAPKCVPSPLQEKHIVSAEHRKHIVTPSGDSEPAKSKLETTPGNYHSGQHQDMLHQASRQRSPHEMKYYKVDQASNIEPNTKTDKHSSFTTRHPPSFTPPTAPVNTDTTDHRPSLMQHGDTKTSHGKPGNERNTLGPSRSPASHEQEAIRRDFQGRLNMLEKKFIKGLEAAAVKPGDDTMLSLHDNIPSGHRKPGAEFAHRVAPVADGIARPLAGNNASPLPSKYSNHDNQRSPAARSSPPGLRVSDRDEQEKPDVSRTTVPSHKPTLPMTSYRPQGNTGGFPRGVPSIDEMKKSPGMLQVLPPHLTRQGAEHAAYHDHMAWAMRSPRSLPSYPLTKINPESYQKSPIEKNNKGKVEHISSKQEEKEISLAREKHLINLAHLENERRKALMVNNDRSRPRLPSRGDERPREERARPGDEHDHLSPRAREEALHRDWEEAETRKRKYAEIRPEILAMHGRISPFGKTPSEQNKRLKGAPTDGRIASHNPLHLHLHEDFNSRKDRYLSMYVNQHADPYGQVASVPYPGRGRNVGNAPFYMGRFDLQRSKTEQNIEVRKEREIVEKIVVEKQSDEKDTNTPESVKKRAKPQKMCDVCRKEASFLCSGCEKAWYCSAKCQFKAWTEHSKECSQTKRR